MTNPDNKQHRLIQMLILTAVSLLASCAELESLVGSVQPGPRPPLAYFAWLESADAETLAREQERLDSDSGRRNPGINLIQRALVYSVPSDSSIDNLDSAMEMLSVALNDAGPDAGTTSRQKEYHAFARIWLSLLENRRDYLLAQEHQVSDRNLIQELSVKVERLEQQIEALTTIEQRLIEREQTQAQQ